MPVSLSKPTFNSLVLKKLSGPKKYNLKIFLSNSNQTPNVFNSNLIYEVLSIFAHSIRTEWS